MSKQQMTGYIKESDRAKQQQRLEALTARRAQHDVYEREQRQMRDDKRTQKENAVLHSKVAQQLRFYNSIAKLPP